VKTLLILSLFLALVVAGCEQPIQPERIISITTPVDGWYQTSIKGYAHSRWLDFISISTTDESVPNNIRFYTDSLGVHTTIPDSILVLNHSDNDTTYVSASIDFIQGNSFFKRFYFPDGYTDKWQPTDKLNLSVFLYYASN
jgi:hypothetical protein